MAITLKYEKKIIAFIDGKNVILRKDVASLIYRCLGAYSLNVEPGVEDTAKTIEGRLDGIKVSVLRMDATENYIAQAIRICFGLKTGAKLEIQEIDKIVELQTTNKESEEGDKGGLQITKS